MRTFAQKPKATKQTSSTNSPKLSRSFVGQVHDINSIFHLQRTIGNQAVLRLLQTATEISDGKAPFFSPVTIQPKLTIEQPNDKYEQEADAIAERVSRMPLESGIRSKALVLKTGLGSRVATPSLSNKPTHTIQQMNFSSSKLSIQRLVREPYPWDGIITSDNAQVFDPDINYREQLRPRTLLSLNSGDRVEVIEFSRPRYLLVRTSDGVEGYIDHNHVDDPTSSRMEHLVGQQLRWTTSDLADYEEPRTGGDAASDFREWAMADSEGSAPSIRDSTMMNCWETILLAAYRLGEVDWSWIHTLYTINDELAPEHLIRPRSRMAIMFNENGEPINLNVQRGDLVFFNGAEHVTLATGEGEYVYSFWPVLRRPGRQYRSGQDEIREETISFIRARIIDLYRSTPTVTYGPPAWQ